ncbi:MAG: leucine-rich repeat domain-containing protein [Clostridia bacterium]|nr:leucine-rich repeat domain-containing protein [Clostridia bacterium]
MKKTSLLFFLCILSLIFAIPCFAASDSYKYDVYTFYIENEEAHITNVSNSIGNNVNIPETLYGYPVGTIANYYVRSVDQGPGHYFDRSYYVGAFGGKSQIVSITMPNSVKNINSLAFRNCTSLRSITLSENLEVIGDYAFENCQSLVSLTIPEGVKSIGNNAFTGCTSLTSITLPKSLESMGESVFSNCPNLRTINIPDGITCINKNSFTGTGLYKNPSNWSFGALYIGEYLIAVEKSNNSALIIKPGTKYIAAEAAINCSSLAHVGFPEGLKAIGKKAFFGCSALTEITLPSGITRIGEMAFTDTAYVNNQDNWENDSLYIGEYLLFVNTSQETGSWSVKSGTTCIADYAVNNNYSIRSINLPSSVKYIGDYAFEGFQNAASCNFPQSIVYVSPTAFYQDYSAPKIEIPNADKANTYTDKNGVVFSADKTELLSFTSDFNLTSYTVPSGTVKIAPKAFRSSRLESIVIPDSVTYIGEEAFYNCYSLKRITLPNSVTYIGDNAFTGTAFYNENSNWTGNKLYIGSHLCAIKSNYQGLLVLNHDTKLVTRSAFWDSKRMTMLIIKNSDIHMSNSSPLCSPVFECISIRKEIGKDKLQANPLVSQNFTFAGYYADSTCTIPLKSIESYGSGTVVYEKWVVSVK